MRKHAKAFAWALFRCCDTRVMTPFCGWWALGHPQTGGPAWFGEFNLEMENRRSAFLDHQSKNISMPSGTCVGWPDLLSEAGTSTMCSALGRLCPLGSCLALLTDYSLAR